MNIKIILALCLCNMIYGMENGLWEQIHWVKVPKEELTFIDSLLTIQTIVSTMEIICTRIKEHPSIPEQKKRPVLEMLVKNKELGGRLSQTPMIVSPEIESSVQKYIHNYRAKEHCFKEMVQKLEYELHTNDLDNLLGNLASLSLEENNIS